MMAYFWLLIMVMLTVSAQLFIKQGATVWPIGSVKALFSKKGIQLGIGFSLAMLAPVFYFLALRTLPLGEAFAFTSINYILVMLAGKYYLHEKVSATQLLGGLLVVIGIALVGIG